MHRIPPRVKIIKKLASTRWGLMQFEVYVGAQGVRNVDRKIGHWQDMLSVKESREYIIRKIYTYIKTLLLISYWSHKTSSHLLYSTLYSTIKLIFIEVISSEYNFREEIRRNVFFQFARNFILRSYVYLNFVFSFNKAQFFSLNLYRF